MSPAAEHQVGPATPGQWYPLATALAAAFQDDPVFGWLLPDPATRPAALRTFFSIETRDIVLRHGCSVAADDGSDPLGAALVLPPGRWRTPLRVQGRRAPDYLAVFGRRLGHALGVLTRIEQAHPRHRHYYLPYIGVTPPAQGSGIGTALLAPVLRRCDAEGLPAYLEASSPDNARLYRRLGFTTVRTIRPLGAPPIELMLRRPAPVEGDPPDLG
jgi:GNAT superfamily N-acetyltransferase